MKTLPVYLALALPGWGLGASPAEPSASPSDLRSVISKLLIESDANFVGRIADKMSEDANAIYYHAKPVEGMPPCREFVGHIKGYDFYIADVTADPSIAALKAAFWSMPQLEPKAGKFELQPDTPGSTPKKEVTVLLLNGRKVANYSHYIGDHEDVFMVGPFGGRPAVPAVTDPAAVATPAAAAAPAAASVAESAVAPVALTKEEKMRAFTAGTQILIDSAGRNFAGQSEAFIRKTEDGDTLSMATVVPEMQADHDAQVILTMGTKNIYMTSYDDENQVAFAFEAFQALPGNGPKGVYSVEQDSRLNKPTSTTYHLRYRGAIVADFIKYKAKPKAILSFGFREGVPANFAASGRTYSAATIEETKRMIAENTVCPGCRGSGKEKIPTGYVYVNSGLPKMKTVGCHFCNGTGHLDE